MFEKFGQVAERTASSLSRRQFFGRFGQLALIVAAGAGGLLALPGRVYAAPHACGPGSDTCYGAKAGDRCFDGGVTGKCHYYAQLGACLCRTRDWR